jgi:hypothetical protein
VVCSSSRWGRRPTCEITDQTCEITDVGFEFWYFIEIAQTRPMYYSLTAYQKSEFRN